VSTKNKNKKLKNNNWQHKEWNSGDLIGIFQVLKTNKTLHMNIHVYLLFKLTGNT